MYTRQKKSQQAIGYGGYGNFGQVPSQTSTGKNPITGATVSFTGPVPDVANAMSVLGLLAGAVSTANKGEWDQARQVLINAKGMVPSTGTQQATLAPIVASVDALISTNGANASAIIGSGVSSDRQTFIYLGLGGVGLLALILLLRR